MEMKKKALKKLIEKEYWKHNQQMLYVRPIEDWWWDPKNRNAFDVFITDKEGEEFNTYLFTIQNLNMFEEVEFEAEWSKLRRRSKTTFCGKSLLPDAAHTPFYMNRVFTLKKFDSITKGDIYDCTNYLMHKVLDCWLLFNINISIKPKEKNEKK